MVELRLDAARVARGELPIDGLDLRVAERTASLALSGDRVLQVLESTLQARRRLRRGTLAHPREEYIAHPLVVGRMGVRRTRVGTELAESVKEPARPVEDHPEVAPLAGTAGRARREEDRRRRRDLGESGREVQGLEDDRRRRQAQGRRERAQIEPDALVALRCRAVDRPVEEFVGAELAREGARGLSPRKRRCHTGRDGPRGVLGELRRDSGHGEPTEGFARGRHVARLADRRDIRHAKDDVSRVEERVLRGKEAVSASGDPPLAEAQARYDAEGIGGSWHGVRRPRVGGVRDGGRRRQCRGDKRYGRLASFLKLVRHR